MSVVADYTIQHVRFDEQVVEGKRLGRQGSIDSRSAGQYPFRAARAQPVVSKEWPRHIPILDQGNMGSCEGNMGVGAVATSPLFEALPGTHPALDENEAVAVYELATHLDTFPGSMPPTDTGTDNTAAMKALRQLGLISGWLTAVTIDDVLQALMAGPVGFGISWYDSFDQPNSSGLVTISPNAVVRGGHAIVCRRVDAARRLVGPDNSWAQSWGVMGSFWISYDDVARLLAESGECSVPQPITVAPPTPQPPPAPPSPDAPTPADRTLASSLGQWPYKRHVGSNKNAALAVQAWEQAKGLHGA